jgi:LuxR family maltose regulon positive regulatory protein
MEIPVLETKLFEPSQLRSTVSRVRLVNELEEGVERKRKMSLVSAPAGYGKTTLVADWLHQGERPFTWLSLDERDNDRSRFLRYIVAAMRKIDLRLGEAVMDLLKSVQVVPFESLLVLLINEVIRLSSTLILVLDDYYSIHNEQIHAGLDFLLRNLPPNMHLVVITRHDPPVSLARLRVEDQVTEIRAEDLRFMPDEAAEFFHRSMDLALNPEEIELLETRTEGWIAGLQLAGLSIRGRDQRLIANFLQSFGGKHRDVMEYLGNEVLCLQGDEVRDFLTKTAVLNRMTGSLCDALTGRKDGQALLLQLEQANLFLVPLDDQRLWYRYHHLFGDFLRAGLDAGVISELHRRASRWFEQRSLKNEAIDHALQGDDTSTAARLIEEAFDQILQGGYLSTLIDWLEKLPDNLVRASGRLVTNKSLILLLIGQHQLAESYVEAAELLYKESPDMAGSARFLIARSALRFVKTDPADTEEIRKISLQLEQALDSIAKEDELSLGVALILLGEIRSWAGDLEGAAKSLKEAITLGQRSDQAMVTLGALSDLVFILNNRQGKRSEAAAICRKFVSKYESIPSNPPPIATVAYGLLGDLEYETNHLDVAEELLGKGLELSRHLGVDISGQSKLVSLYLARGETDRANRLIQEALENAGRASYQKWVSVYRSAEADFHIRQGNLDTVSDWIGELDIDDILPRLWDCGREYQCLTYVRYQIARRNHREAMRILESHLNWASKNGFVRSLITNGLLRSRVYTDAGDRELALESLKRAVELAAPQEYYRAFLDEDLPLVDLLRRSSFPQQQFVEKLLAYAVQDYSRSAPEETGKKASLLSEPLSEREEEILRYIESGLTNREIADRCYIALSTVKTHINNIYGKLDVRNRTQALARARELSLL